MYDTLASIHEYTGYLVFVVALFVSVYGFNRAKSGFEFKASPFSAAAVLLDLQVLLGIVMYVTGEVWSADATFAFIHPLIMLAGLGIAHAGVAGARREQMAADAYRKASRMLAVGTIVIAVGIGVASMA